LAIQCGLVIRVRAEHAPYRLESLRGPYGPREVAL